jgi:aspartate/methionine/tyrosine aminotransferase
MIYKYDFSWGDTRGIREVMMKHAAFLQVSNMPWETFGYPPHDGTPQLKSEISSLIGNLTKHNYKYVLITGGATHALNAFVAAMRSSTTRFMYTNKLYFSRYPGIAANLGLQHVRTDKINPRTGDVGLIDSPSNPLGRLTAEGNNENVVWDAAYYSPTYCGLDTPLRCYPIIPKHVAMAGSLSKLTGINGLRIGWLATDDVSIYEKALSYITSNLCGVSQPSQYAAHQILTKVDMQSFFKTSKALIDNNKTEMSRLDYLFGYQEMPRHGMFNLWETDDKLKNLLEKASVLVMPGSQCGDTRESVRFNLANPNAMTRDMINAVLKADGK